MILFVCTGNTCRSPLAAALARAHGVDAQSAGLDADRGDPATIEAQFAAEHPDEHRHEDCCDCSYCDTGRFFHTPYPHI